MVNPSGILVYSEVQSKIKLWTTRTKTALTTTPWAKEAIKRSHSDPQTTGEKILGITMTKKPDFCSDRTFRPTSKKVRRR